MSVNNDFTKKAVVKAEDYRWVSSPVQGVERMMLDRIGGEVARATSLVRYAAHTSFSSHTHSGGEEFYVLSGTFGDEHGLYPEGTYVRNPIGTHHTPRVGDEGAVIFVKLHQFSSEDKKQVQIDTKTSKLWAPGLVDGLSVLSLHQFDAQSVALVKWEPNTQFQSHQHWGGEEIFVLSGVFYDEYDEYPEGSWIRSPHMSRHQPYTKSEGALIYVKVGHLVGCC